MLEELDDLFDERIIHSYDFIQTSTLIVVKDGNLGIPTTLLPDLLSAASTRYSSYPCLHSSTILLIINPEHYTAWNTRRRSLELDLAHELWFSRLVLHKHPKRAAAWSYRDWLLRKMDVIDVKNEVDLALHAAGKYYQNYHAWSHLRRIYAYMKASVSLLPTPIHDAGDGKDV